MSESIGTDWVECTQCDGNTFKVKATPPEPGVAQVSINLHCIRCTRDNEILIRLVGFEAI